MEIYKDVNLSFGKIVVIFFCTVSWNFTDQMIDWENTQQILYIDNEAKYLVAALVLPQNKSKLCIV